MNNLRIYRFVSGRTVLEARSVPNINLLFRHAVFVWAENIFKLLTHSVYHELHPIMFAAEQGCPPGFSLISGIEPFDEREDCLLMSRVDDVRSDPMSSDNCLCRRQK